MKGDGEYIACSAIHYNDGKKYEQQPININVGIVISGLRHCNCYATIGYLLGMGNYDKGKIEQGFITSSHRYVDREEGLAIAIAAGQVKERRYHYGLDSSDLY